MASETKKNASGLNRLKNFFKGTKPTSDIQPLRNTSFEITSTTFSEISQSQHINVRIKGIKELTDIFKNKLIRKEHVITVWNCISDLKNHENIHVRHTILKFLLALIEGQFNDLGIMRAGILCYLSEIYHNEDFELKVSCLLLLTDNGKNLKLIEEETGDTLCIWLDEILKNYEKQQGKNVIDFIKLVSCILKYNSAHIDEEFCSKIIVKTCELAQISCSLEELKVCLELLKCILGYFYLPKDCLCEIVVCLCKTLNAHKDCVQTVWNVMKSIFSCHLGHGVVIILCSILEDKEKSSEIMLLRGAVYFLGAALWGNERCQELKCPVSIVLPYFVTSLINSKNPLVAYEISRTTRRLIEKYGNKTEFVTWDPVLDIVQCLMDFIYTSNHTPEYVLKEFHQILTDIETIYDKDTETLLSTYIIERFLSIVECCAKDRSDTSIYRLIKYKMMQIDPNSCGWTYNLRNLVDTYYKSENRINIRIQVLQDLSVLVSKQSHLYENELIDDVILPVMSNVDQVKDSFIRQKITEFFIQICKHCTSSKFQDILNLLEKIINRPFSTLATKMTSPNSANSFDDVNYALIGLAKMLESKIISKYYLTNQILSIYNCLVKQLKRLYSLPNSRFMNCSSKSRYEILKALLSIRCDNQKRVGIVYNEKVRYTSGVLCSHSDDHENENLTLNVNYLNYAQAFSCFVSCLQIEKDWDIFELLFRELAKVLRNKSLVLTADRGDIELFCKIICDMIATTPTAFEAFRLKRDINNTKSDFHCAIFPVLTCLPSYYNFLSRPISQQFIKCLGVGLFSKCSKLCVWALSVCAFEMSSILMRELPSILIIITQLTPTPHLSTPLMEFLNTIIRIPSLYSNFCDTDYLSVFAIALQYTNPFRYSQYTVSLAYQVICVWFMKCKLETRKCYVSFIVRGLVKVFNLYEELDNKRKSEYDMSKSKNDFRNRASTTNTNFTSVKNAKAMAMNSVKMSKDPKLFQFYKELTETCIDLLSRFAYANCSNIPKRSPVSEFLLENGLCEQWVVGNNIVTITTSGNPKVGFNGICAKCLSLAKQLADRKNKSTKDILESNTRRRHQSAAVKSTPQSTTFINQKSQDDMTLLRPNSFEENSTSDKSGTDKAVDILLELNKNEPGDESIFTSHICSCWCNAWVEVHIRRPTGNVSWMMRIQNDLGSLQTVSDFSLWNMHLLMQGDKQKKTPKHKRRKFDSTCLQESDYDELHQQIFLGTSFNTKESEENFQVTKEELEVPVTSSELKKSTSTPVLSVDMITKLTAGNLKTELQEVFIRSQDIAKNSVANEDSLDSSSQEISTPELENEPQTNSYNKDENLDTMIHKKDDCKEKKVESDRKGVIDPNFVFLQLLHSATIGKYAEGVFYIPKNCDSINRSVRLLDFKYPFETYKIAILYVGLNQTTEKEILSNSGGSLRYANFLNGLGSLLKLDQIKASMIYTGGLDIENGDDGEYAYCWHDDFMQVIFHVATLMPKKSSDPKFNLKKRHIGNDYVTIVYNDSLYSCYKLGTIVGEFNYVNIIIDPLDGQSNAVTVQTKNDITEIIGHTDTKIISDDNLSKLVRQMAVHANLASEILQRQKSSPTDPYASNWLERLRQIKKIKEKVEQETNERLSNDGKPMTNYQHIDFTSFCYMPQ